MTRTTLPVDMAKRNYKRRVDQVQAALKRGDMGADELAKHMSMSTSGAGHVLTALERDGMIHVCAFKVGVTGRPKGIYRWGKGQRANMPGPRPPFRKRVNRTTLPPEIGRELSMQRILAGLSSRKASPNTYQE